MKRSQVQATTPPARADVADIPHDGVNEQIVIAAAMADDTVRDNLVKRIPVDAMLTTLHRQIWAAFLEMSRKQLAYDPATAQTFLGKDFDMEFLARLQESRPDLPPNLDYHVELILWDRCRLTAVTGPIAQLLDAIKNNRTAPERVRGFARQVAGAFEGYEERKYLRDSDALVQEQIADINERVLGRACYPFGIDALDKFEKGHAEEGKPRLIPGAAPGKMTVVCGVPGGGKALAVDTPILTTRGWSTMGDLRVGDEVFDENGKPCTVLACSAVMHNRPCYTLHFSDKTAIVADAEHQWVTHSRTDRRARNGGQIRTTALIVQTLETDKDRRLNHSIPLAKPLQYPTASLPVDPYVLGAWLGDGTSSNGTITVGEGDEEILDHIRTAGFTISRQSAVLRWNILGLAPIIRDQLHVNDDKRIPPEYLRASFEQRLALLQGLMDTDGGASTDGRCEFTTTSPSLSVCFDELLTSLGIKVCVSHGEARLRGRYVGPKWRYAIRTNISLFRLRRKRERQEVRFGQIHSEMHRVRYITGAVSVDSVPVRCISVSSPSKLFLAGRQLVPTHNSTFTARMALGLGKLKKRVLVGAWEMSGGELLELIACQSLGFSRHDFSIGKVTGLQVAQLREEMETLSEYIKFMDIPFNRNAGEKQSNDRNLDIIQNYIAAAGPDVFIADLWKRALRYADPGDEEQALIRQQSMLRELNVHGVLVQQLRAKDVESRADKRPTRESIKGSGAWIEVPDNIIGIHRPGIWKDIPDDHIDAIILKQRFGEWPMVVQFNFDKRRGMISGGVTVPYTYDEKPKKSDKQEDAFLDD